MTAVIEILIAFIIVAAVCVPLANTFSKWKKEMDDSNDRK